MNPRAVVAFVLIFSVLMITAVPANVSAASEQLVVGSQHSTDTEFNNAETDSNLKVSGSGESAYVDYTTVFHSFEDGDLSEWSGDTGSFSTTTSTATDGSYSMVGNSSSAVLISRTFSTNANSALRFDWRVDGFAGGFAPSTRINNDGSEGIRIVIDDGTHTGDAGSVVVLNSFDNYEDTGLDVTQNTFYRYELSNIDYSTNTFDLTISEVGGSTVGTATDMEFRNAQDKLNGMGVASRESYDKYWDNIHFDTGPVSGDGTYVSQNHSVVNSKQAAINFSKLDNATANVTIEGWDGSQWVTLNKTTGFSSAGNKTLTWSESSASKVRTTVVFSEETKTPDARLADESILFTDQAPVVDAASASPSGGETIQTQSPTLSINVTDREFGTTQGDTVTATAYDAGDDSQIGATTLNANGTASVTWSDPLTGSNSYYWVVEDSYGESTTTQDFTFQVPGTLRVFNESAPNTKINDTVGLRVRFFATESGTVVERDVTNGTADLTGLPADQPIAITLKDETDGYVYRRITIDSIVEQQDIYLLPTQANSVQVVFELEDPTGQFAPEETRLLVEKPIKKDFDGDGGNETRYQVVSGDLFGSSGQYPAQLLQDERYRLRVLTEDGNERILGSYTAFASTTEPLQIEQIEPKADQDAGEALYGDVEVANGGNTTTATIRYQNLGDESTTVEYRILAGNQTVIGNVTSDADTFAHVYNVSSANATTFTVEYMIKKPTTTEYGQFKLGGIAGVAGRLSIDAQVLSIISWLLILSTMGLVVIVDPKLAPAGGTGMASGLVILGAVAIPAPVLGVAGAVSVLTLVGGGES